MYDVFQGFLCVKGFDDFVDICGICDVVCNYCDFGIKCSKFVYCLCGVFGIYFLMGGQDDIFDVVLID